jgi:hypothetical protein
MADQKEQRYKPLNARECDGMTAKDRKRIRDLHALMVGSSSQGERENARGKLEKLLKRLGKTWNDLPDLLRPGQPSPQSTDPRDAAASNNPHPFDDPRFNPCTLINGMIEKCVALDPHQRLAVALWIVHTHLYDRFLVTPRLVLTSPVRGCGKSTLLDVIRLLVAKPEKSDNITAAVIYHHAHETKATLLLDEADNLELGAKHAMRAVLNAGHRKGGRVNRIWHGEPHRFDVFTPVALAAIGGLSLPLMHRSVVIHMERHDGARPLHRLDAVDNEFDVLYSYTRKWVQRTTINSDPQMPSELRNRVADNWRPLIAIADACGPEVGMKAREAAVALSRHQRDEDAAVILLHDIRQAFDARGVDRIMSRTLVDDLIAMPDAEWSEWRGPLSIQQPRKLTTGALATMLRAFRIRPRTIWPLHRTPGTKSAKGYFRSQFEQVWRSYCDEPGTSSQSHNIRWLDRAVG